MDDFPVIKVGTFEEEMYGGKSVKNTVPKYLERTTRKCRKCGINLKANSYFKCVPCRGEHEKFGFDVIHEGENISHCSLAYWGD